MYLRIKFHKVDIDTQQNIVANIFHVGDLFSLKATVNNIPIYPQIDELDKSIALFKIDLPKITDSAIFHIEAVCKIKKESDFNEDFNDDFTSDAIEGDFNEDFNYDFYNDSNELSCGFNTIKYENTFKIFGYDLGNNVFIDHNLPFDIYLVNDKQDFNSDFSKDFDNWSGVYANGLYIREPFTDKVYLYDNTSSNGKVEWLIRDKKIDTRNTLICLRECLDVKVTKTGFDTITVLNIGTTCGCGSNYNNNIQYIETEKHSNIVSINHNPKQLGFPVNTILLDCLTVCKSTDAETNIDYNLYEYYRNDIPFFGLEKDVLIKELFRYNGDRVLYEEEEITNFKNYFPKRTQISLHEIGDYVLKTTLLSFVGDKIVRKFEDIDKYHNHNFIEYIQLEKCAGHKLSNKCFDEIKVDIYKYTESNKKLVKEYKNSLYLKGLSEIIFEFNGNGIYILEYSRNGKHESSLIVFEFCKLLNCIKDIIDAILARTKCEHNINDGITLDTIQLTYLHLLAKLEHYNIIHKTYISAFTNPQLIDLYHIDFLIEKLDEYCKKCLQYKNPCPHC